MGHLVGKDLYRKLGKKIDNLTMKTPWNEKFYSILRELYSEDEAQLVIRMPYGLTSQEKVEEVTGYDKTKLQKLLDSLSGKGLVMDIEAGSTTYYMLSPLVIGIFEFTMMRTGDNLRTTQWAGLFHDYLNDPQTFYVANYGTGQKISPLRALPHEGTVEESAYVEVLDYEKASAIVDSADKFAVGICSCRHEKLHVGEKKCQVPLETCSTFGASADYMIRHGFAREVSQTEMKENLARSRELGLVLCADNVRNDISFICCCCGCCCNVLLGISKFGFPNTVVTSNFIARSDSQTCLQCGICAQTCPIKAITMSVAGQPIINESVCIGCGVCSLECSSGALKLSKREQRVLHPEDTFARVILQSLERGTLQNLLFANPQSVSHGFMRTFVGAFLKLPPVKRALISDKYRSRFLSMMRKGSR